MEARMKSLAVSQTLHMTSLLVWACQLQESRHSSLHDGTNQAFGSRHTNTHLLIRRHHNQDRQPIIRATQLSQWHLLTPQSLFWLFAYFAWRRIIYSVTSWMYMMISILTIISKLVLPFFQCWLSTTNYTKLLWITDKTVHRLFLFF